MAKITITLEDEEPLYETSGVTIEVEVSGKMQISTHDLHFPGINTTKAEKMAEVAYKLLQNINQDAL